MTWMYQGSRQTGLKLVTSKGNDDPVSEIQFWPQYVVIAWKKSPATHQDDRHADALIATAIYLFNYDRISTFL